MLGRAEILAKRARKWGRVGLVALARLAVLAALCLAWQNLLGPMIGISWFPSLFDIFGRLGSWTADGSLWANLWTTTAELVASLVIGGILGLVLGLLIGFYVRVRDSVYPIAVIIYIAPHSIFVPLVISSLGFGIESKVFLGTWTALFIVLFSTMGGVRATQKRMLEGLYLMGAADHEVLWKVLMPASRKWVVAGLKVAMPLTLVGIVTAEIFGSERGLGFLVENSAGSADMVGLYAAVILLAILGVVTNQIIDLVDKRVEGLGDGGDR
jgi:NitT/TauT family transport system permease protein